MLPAMQLNQLRAFEAVARTGSFSRAAEELSVTQPAVTVQVRHLERHCGVQLFERVRRRPHLTQAGQTLYAYAQRIFALVTEAAGALDLARGLRSGRLRIVSGRTPAAYHIPPFITKFRERYPALEIQLKVESTQRALEAILALTDDLAVLSSEPRHPDLVREPLCDDVLALVVPPHHPWTRRRSVSFQDLSQVAFIQREPGSSTRALIEERMAQEDVALRVAMELGSNEAIKRSVETGHGVALLSVPIVQLEVESERLAIVNTQEPAITRQFFLSFHRERRDSPLIQAAVEVGRALYEKSGLRRLVRTSRRATSR